MKHSHQGLHRLCSWFYSEFFASIRWNLSPPPPPQTLLYIPRYLIGTLSSTSLTLPGIPYHLHVIYVTHLQSLKNNFTSIPSIILRPFIRYKCISQTQLSLLAVLVETWTGKPTLKNNNILWNIVITSSAVCRSDPVLPSVASRVLPIKKIFFTFKLCSCRKQFVGYCLWSR